LRLFVAAGLPPVARAACAAWGPDERALVRVGETALHLTLAFLGEVGDPTPLPARLAPCAAPARGLALVGGRWLPPRRPRVLALEVDDPAGELRALQARVAHALDHTEGRPFLPHVSVARVRGRLRPGALPPAPTVRFDAVALTLFRSALGSGPPRYEALWSANLT
jgi:2'-5' RNA ligase